MERKITLITNYYPPETGAAANRIALMAENFVKAGFETTVLCPLPNYPTGKIFNEYRDRSRRKETINGVHIKRLWVYATNSANIWKRFWSMISFSISLAKYALLHKTKGYVFIQCSPLLIGFFATFFFKGKNRKLLLNVSDLWPLAGKELGKLKDGLGYKTLERLERYNYKKADLVLGQSEEILSHVIGLFPQKQTFLYRNLPDFSVSTPSENTSDIKRIVYAGLLGIAQGILKLCNEIELPDNWELHIYGDGAEKKNIQMFLSNSEKKIYYAGSLSRKQLHKKLTNYDIAIIPLLKRIYGSVPSKIFEYSRLGLPLLYFGGGEGEVLVLEKNLGEVVEAGNYTDLNAKLEALSIDYNMPSKKEVQLASNTAFNSKLQFEALIEKLELV